MEKAYVCITVSYKHNFSDGTAIYKLIEISQEDLQQCREVVYSDKRPSKDHCVKIFSDSFGMIYGRLNKAVRSIIDNCNCMISSQCKRGDYDLRADLHTAYCNSYDNPFNSEADQERSIRVIQHLNSEFDL